MVIQEQIKQLFELLGHGEKILILKELQMVNINDRESITDIPVEVCPYCSSNLVVKN